MRFDELQAASPPPSSPKPAAPLLPIAVGLIGGIAADNFFQLPTLASLGLFALGCGLYYARPRSERIAFAAVVVAAAGLGTLRHAVADRWIAEDHIVRFTQDEPILVHIRGEVLTPPEIVEPKPDAVLAYKIGPKTRLVIEAKSLDGAGGPIGVSGRVAVTVKAPIETSRLGDTVEMTGWLYRPRGPRNPGEYNWALHQKRNGIRAAFVCDHGESVQVVAPSDGRGWPTWIAGARARMRGYLLDSAFEDEDPASGVVAAMVLAQRSAVSREINEAFIRTGNAHFLAASGMNIAWLVAVGWTVMRVMGTHYRIAAIVVAALIVSYVLLAEPEPSILRAGIVGLLWCVSIFLRGRTHALNWLACSAVVILMIDPMDVFRPGFQFSFIAVLGLLYLLPLVASAMASVCLRLGLPRVAHAVDHRLYAANLVMPIGPPPSATSSLMEWIAVWLLMLLAMSITAWFVTAPLSCYIFNTLNPWGAPCTFLVSFLALPVTCIGYIATLVGALFPFTGPVIGPVLAATAHAMLGLVEWLATLPGMAVDGRQPSIGWLLAFYAVLGLRVYQPQWMTGRPEPESPESPDRKTSTRFSFLRRHSFKVAAMVLFLWWLIPPRWATIDRDALKVWMLAVGDGTGTVIELPNGGTLLYDFGTRSSFDAGPPAVNFLKHRGINQIDAAFISHTDFDHYSAIATIARHIPIRRVIVNDHFARFAGANSGPGHFLDALRKSGVPIETWSGPQTLADTGEVQIMSIWPPPANDRPLVDANETSTVLRVTHQGRSILLTGDIAEAAMGTLLANPALLKADVLALPHHGAVVHNTAAFIAAANSRVAVRSSGQRRGLTTSGIEALVGDRSYFCTADDGCVRVTIRDGELTAEAVMTNPSTR
ncbi:MAG TPA: ComEC/Rec2 family competence protein [Phycisphaerae bacterium]|nr:ComEC/Rec2 family competence protein [Phycisphaerae bacterium]